MSRLGTAITTLVLVTILSSCTSANRSLRVLQEAGYNDVVIGGYAPFACSKDDFYATRFTANGPTGRQTSGTVCAGVFKGATIRLD